MAEAPDASSAANLKPGGGGGDMKPVDAAARSEKMKSSRFMGSAPLTLFSDVFRSC